MSLAEMVYLIEKGRIPARALQDLHAATADPNAVLQHVPLDENIAMQMAKSLATRYLNFPTELSLRLHLFTVYRS